MSRFLDVDGTSLEQIPARDDAISEGQARGHDFDHLAAMPVCDGTYISTATTTTVSSGPCVLHSIVLGETAAGAITIYDNTAGSGTIIGVLKASIVEGTYTFNRQCTTGLTLVTAGASKLTVNYVPVAA